MRGDMDIMGGPNFDRLYHKLKVMLLLLILLFMKNTRQKAATIASNSDSLPDSNVCNQSLVSSLIHEKSYPTLVISIVVALIFQ